MNKTALAIRQQELDKRGQDLNRKNVKTTARYRLAGDAIKAAASIIPSGSYKLGAQDPEWYKQFVQDLDKYTNINLFYRLGAPIDKNNTPLFKNHLNSIEGRIPGICRIEFAPTIGSQERLVSAAGLSDSQQSFNMFLTQMRKLNSRVGEYEPTEIGLALNCSVDLAAMIERLGFVLKVSITFDGENRYIGDAIILAAGFNPSDVRTNRAEYLQEHAMLVKQFNTNIVIPRELSLVKRRIWMQNLLLRDCGSSRSQLYMFYQNSYFIYDDVNNGANVYIMPQNNQITLGTFIAQIKQRYLAIVDSPTLVTMYSDMRAAFSDDKLFKLFDISMDEEVTFIESDEIMEQIHNLDTLVTREGQQPDIDYNSVKLYTNSNGYLCQGNSSSQYLGIRSQTVVTQDELNLQEVKSMLVDAKLLNYYQESDYVSGDDILVSTRLKADFHLESGYLYYNICGTELVSKMRIFNIDLTDNIINASVQDVYKYIFRTVITAGETEYMSIAQAIRYGQLSCFNEHPICHYWLVYNNNGTHTLRDTLINGEIENYALISSDNLRQIHKACVMSEYFVKESEFNRNN